MTSDRFQLQIHCESEVAELESSRILAIGAVLAEIIAFGKSLKICRGFISKFNRQKVGVASKKVKMLDLSHFSISLSEKARDRQEIVSRVVPLNRK